MGNVKASAVIARMEYIKRFHGEDGYRKWLTALEPHERAQLQGLVLPQSWVPFSLFVSANVVADRLFGNGDLRLCIDMGRFGADLNLTTLYKIFYRLTSVAFIMSKAASLWNMHYDSGRLTVLGHASSGLRLRIEDFDQPHHAHCLSVLGWASRSIELSGGKLISADETSCRTQNANICEFAFRWS